MDIEKIQQNVYFISYTTIYSIVKKKMAVNFTAIFYRFLGKITKKFKEFGPGNTSSLT